MIRVVLCQPQKLLQVGRIWSQADRVFQFANRIIVPALRGQRDGVPLEQVRLFRRRPQGAFEISAGIPGASSLHFSYPGKKVSV